MPPALNHIYSGAVTVHRHLNGESSQQAIAAPAASAPAQAESSDRKESKEKKNESSAKSDNQNTAKTGGGWDEIQYQKSNQEKVKTLPEK